MTALVAEVLEKVFDESLHGVGETGLLHFSALLQQCLKGCDNLEILRATGGPLHLNQSFQRHALITHSVGFHFKAMRQELFVISASRNFAQYIQLPEIGIQGEVQTVTNRFFVEDKGQARRRTTQVWMERHQSLI